MMPLEEKVACPHCGCTEFAVCGFVCYRQPYDGLKEEYGFTDVKWDGDYPEHVECLGCQQDVTEYFRKRGILDAFFGVEEKKPKTS